jgi:BirA family biotin operon repressor/biotin-[acetyl-CoA-carboxylase] ligase
MTVPFQPTILRFDAIDSTNLEAIRQAKAGAPEGLCIVAKEQTAGRGRLERRWESPKGAGLYVSILLRPQLDLNVWPLITLMSALAVLDALARVCDLCADIKWPNDICIGLRKLCGILAETIETKSGMAAIVGMGINLKNDQSLPPDVVARATSVQAATGHAPDPEVVLRELIRAFGERYEALLNDGGAEQTIREWCANSSYAFDRRVRVSLNTEVFDGTTRGLESDGALRVETDDGKVRTVRAGDVTALREA